MKKSILILLSLLSPMISFSQIEIPLSIGLGGGIDIISNKDLAASPLTYNGFGLPIGINGFKTSSKWINHFETRLILPVVTNNYLLSTNSKTNIIDWAKVDLSYRLLRQIGKDSNNFLGGEITSNFFYREYDFLDGYGWEFQNSLNLNYARTILINSKSFILPQVSVPLVGYINRKPSLTFDEVFLDDLNNNGAASLLKYGEWRVPFYNWIAIKLDLLYSLKLSDRFNLQAQIGCNYYSIGFPEKVQNINFPIRCYINYQF